MANEPIITKSRRKAKAKAAVDKKEELIAKARTDNSLPAEWTDDQVLDWLSIANLKETRTDRGNWIYDPTRATRDPSTWVYGEIADWVEGRLYGSTTESDLTAAVVSRYRERELLNKTWTPEEVLTYVRYGQAPTLTANGNPIYSEVREGKKAVEWTNSELEDWANGSITQTPTASDQQIALELKTRYNLPAECTSVFEIRTAYREGRRNDTIEKTKDGLTEMNERSIKSTLDEYKAKVAPGIPVTEAVGVRAQESLDRLFGYVLNLQGDAFIGGMDMLRDFIKENRSGLFDETYAFRFTPLMHMSQGAIRGHSAIITGFCIITGPNPQFIKAQDWLFNLSDLSDMHRNKLIEYFDSQVK